MKHNDLGLDQKTRRTHNHILLDEIEQVMVWAGLPVLIAQHAPVDKTGRTPFELPMMLRIRCLQQRFALSDMGAVDALFETSFYHYTVAISGIQRIADWVSILRFGHLFDEHDTCPKSLPVINAKPAAQGLLLKTGSMVDPTLIGAPSSTKDNTRERDPEMHQTKKGNLWHFGMKAHIGVDADTSLVHTVISTAANVNDVTQEHAMLHGLEQIGFKGAGYRGGTKRDEATGVEWHISMCTGKGEAHKHTHWGALLDQAEKLKAGVQAKVEHPFKVIKRQFGHSKVRYRALSRNTAQLMTLFALSNIWMARKVLLQRVQA